MRFLRNAALAALVVLGSGIAHAADKANTVIMELASGKVVIELLPDLAPGHVERVKQLVTEHFYDGVPFHRVIPDFMAQTGDPTGTGTGGSKYPDLKAEFTDTPFVRGTIGAARTDNPDSANSQFFICFNDTGCAHLKGQYTVWGKVVEGMELIDAVKSGGDSVADPDKIVSMTMMQ
ncbi:MAG: peptidylprolyl isomerase [Hyphomicrobiaceae bacterium]|mgnify:CR=1 FL=1